MNTRDNKQFVPGGYYHVYNRGNAKGEVFYDEQDFSFFLYRFKENITGRLMSNHGRYIRRLLPAGAFTLISYCLMPNHFHLLIRQNGDIPVSELLLRICTGYSKYFNRKYERVGHIFQDQFKAIMIDTDSYLLWLSAYIHTNPVVAGLASKPEEYVWSSYLDYLGVRPGTLCKKEFILSQAGGVRVYQNFVEQSIQLVQQHKELDDYLLD